MCDFSQTIKHELRYSQKSCLILQRVKRAKGQYTDNGENGNALTVQETWAANPGKDCLVGRKSDKPSRYT